MPWHEVSVMEQRREFIRLAEQEGASRRELCRRFGISPETGYKWLCDDGARRSRAGEPLARPKKTPTRCTAEPEAAVLEVRDAHPAWGARKLWRCLKRQGIEPPALSTVHAILSRHGRIDHDAASVARTYCRFEKEAPNHL